MSTIAAAYLFLRHVEIAAHVAYCAASTATERAALAVWSLLDTACMRLREASTHENPVAHLRGRARGSVTDPRMVEVMRALTLAADVVEAGGDAEKRSDALDRAGVDVDALTEAMSSLREALYPAPWAELARAERKRADAWAACASTWAGFAEPDAERHPDIKAACDRVNGTVREAIRLRTICGPVPAEDGGHDPDAAPYTLSPLASDPLPADRSPSPTA